MNIDIILLKIIGTLIFLLLGNVITLLACDKEVWKYILTICMFTLIFIFLTTTITFIWI